MSSYDGIVATQIHKKKTELYDKEIAKGNNCDMSGKNFHFEAARASHNAVDRLITEFKSKYSIPHIFVVGCGSRDYPEGHVTINGYTPQHQAPPFDNIKDLGFHPKNASTGCQIADVITAFQYVYKDSKFYPPLWSVIKSNWLRPGERPLAKTWIVNGTVVQDWDNDHKFLVIH